MITKQYTAVSEMQKAMMAQMKKAQALAPTQWLATTYLNLTTELLRMILAGFTGPLARDLFRFSFSTFI